MNRGERHVWGWICLPVVWALGHLGPAVGLLLHWLQGLGLRGLVLHLDHVGGAGLGRRGEATECGEGRRAVGVQTFGLELRLSQEHLPPVHLLLQVIVVGLAGGQSLLLLFISLAQ